MVLNVRQRVEARSQLLSRSAHYTGHEVVNRLP